MNKNKSEKNNFQDDIKKHKKLLEFFSSVLFGRLVFVFFLIFLQILLIFVLTKKFSSYISFYFGGSILFSTIFMCYLSNSKGKNEFKIAWILPMVIFPFFAIFAYILYHVDYGGYKFKKQIVAIKNETDKFLPPLEETCQTLKKYPEIGDLAFYLDKLGHYPSFENNELKYYPSGEEFFPDFICELEKAEKFIFIEYFIIKIDESWGKVLDVLTRKAKEGVEIRILFDAIGSVSAASSRYVKFLKSLGINAQIFSPIFPVFSIHYNNRDHRKIVVIDGKTSFTGGVNIANEYFNVGKGKFKYWKDTAIKIKGSAIKNFTVMFLHTWNLGIKNYREDFEKYINVDYEVFKPNGLVTPYGDNAFNNEDIAENIYRWIIGSSKKYVHITSPYLVIDNQLACDLIFAAHRGIDVSLILPGKGDHYVTYAIGKTFIKDLVDNGVKVYLYKNDSFIHAKMFISDDKTAAIGSVNLDYRSLYHHFECGVLLHQCDEIGQMEKDFMETLKDCVLLDKDFYKKVPFITKLIGKSLRIMAPLF